MASREDDFRDYIKAQKLFRRAKEALDSREFDEAEKLFERIKELAPKEIIGDESTAYLLYLEFEKSRLLEDKRSTESYLQALRHFHQTHSHLSVATKLLMSALMSLGKTAEARTIRLRQANSKLRPGEEEKPFESIYSATRQIWEDALYQEKQTRRQRIFRLTALFVMMGGCLLTTLAYILSQHEFSKPLIAPKNSSYDLGSNKGDARPQTKEEYQELIEKIQRGAGRANKKAPIPREIKLQFMDQEIIIKEPKPPLQTAVGQSE